MISSATPSQRGIGTGPATPGGPDPRHDHVPSGPRSTRDFDTFYLEMFPVLVRQLVWLAGDVGDAEEAAQAAMLDVYRRWWQIERPEAYVFTAARNALLRERRRTQSLMPRLVANAALENRVGLQPEAAATDQQDADSVVEILEALPPRQREVLALLVDGFTTAEVAEELNLTTTAVRSNLYKARRNLARRWMNRDHLLSELSQ